MRILLAFDRFGPYHWARARAANAHAGIDLATLEFRSDDPTYEWDPCPPPAGARHYRGTGFTRVLDMEKPDVVAVPGWGQGFPSKLLAACRKMEIPAVVMSESNAWDFPRSRTKEWWKRRRVRKFGAGLVGGRSHLDYLVDLGMPAEKIALGYDAVDNVHFSRVNGVRDRPADVPDDPFFLASARFVPKKNLAGLIRAFHQAGTGWHLVILGDGPLRAPLEALVGDLGLTGRVHLPGFKQYGELPGYYAAASAFVHASTTEQWGLVTNEALAAGLPVLVSDRCGCAHELDVPTFDPHDTKGLARRLERLCHEKHSPETSVATIGPYGPERFASGLFEAGKAALRP